MRSIRTAFSIMSAVALVAACSSSGGGDAAPSQTGPVTLTWWHNGSSEPLKSLWQQVADDYHAAHPNVSFQVEPIQNEQFQTKVPLALQSDNPPDLYQQWGGGQLASQITSGKVKDITADTSGWIGQLGKAKDGWQIDGKQYGVPYVLHAVGFWYRKDIFTNAGITAPPSTMAELADAVTKLKAAKVTPIAIGGKDKWPDAFYWAYFAVRGCSTDTLKSASKTMKLDDGCWTKAGEDVKAFLGTNPFQDAFLGTPAQQGAGSSAGMLANGQAAMELQGDWEPSTMAALTSDKDLSSKLGWFPFPAVSGGKGDPAVLLGGGDGFSCTTKAPPACADFLKYITGADVQKKLAAAGVGLPVNPDAAAAVTDSATKSTLEKAQKAPYIQTYFDIAFPTAVGQALNDAIANFFAGKGTPQSIVQAVTDASTGGR
ncbi:extracellular solute-binding protein [Actinocrispum sp. NPDC049592]|uniref:ABC transporter substrate-binding protein n=1 Tax=Actinocrispum sp. NPDC049592 TaxID=3154835 RepID=UPI003437DB99